MKTYRLYWVSCAETIAIGIDFADAFARAGYTTSDLKNLRWYEEV